MNLYAVRAILPFEMAHRGNSHAERYLAGDLDIVVLCRLRRGDRLAHSRSRGRGYGAFIVPGLIMLSLLTQSISNASFRHLFQSSAARSTNCFPRRSLPGSSSCVGAAATKSIMLGANHLATSALFVPLRVAHVLDAALLILTSVTSAWWDSSWHLRRRMA